MYNNDIIIYKNIMNYKAILNFDFLSGFFIILSSFFLPFIFWPNNNFSANNLKFGLFFGAVLISLVFFSIGQLRKNDFKIPFNLTFLSILLVIIFSLLSAFFSDNLIISLFGIDLNFRSFSGILILFISSLLLSSYLNSENKILVSFFVIYISLILSLFFNLIYILFDLPNFGFFTNNAVNTIGKWTDFGVISAFGVIFSCLILDLKKKKDPMFYISLFGLLISIFITIIVSEIVVWILLAVSSILYLIYKLVSQKQNNSNFVGKNFPYGIIAIFLVSFVMILIGNFVSDFVDKKFNIYFSEIKPSISSTFETTKNVLVEDPLFGSGLNRFERSWQKHKPDPIIQSNYWGSDFVYGYSYFFSLPSQVGIFGGLAWLFLIIMILWNSLKILFKKTDNLSLSRINILTSFSIIFFVIALFLQVPSMVVLVYFFVFLGIFLGNLNINKFYKSYKISVDQKPKISFIYVFSVITLMVFVIYFGYICTKQFISIVFFDKANQQLMVGNLNLTRENLFNSLKFNQTDLNLRALSEYYKIEINNLLSSSDLNNKSTVDSFRELLGNSINASVAAINFDKNNYINYYSLADTYSQLVSLKVDGSYDQAMEIYKKALEVNPKNPGIYIDMARVSFNAGNINEAKNYINKALEIKPRFVDANFLLSQIQVSEGNISSAIQSLDLAISIEPNNPNLYFQLGLLRYNQKDYIGSVSAFERAVVLNKVFANAKYFLGLSYDKLGRKEEAIVQFEDLKTTNPDNQEILNILNNLKFGLGAIGEEETPESEEDLPVEEKEEE